MATDPRAREVTFNERTAFTVFYTQDHPTATIFIAHTPKLSEFCSQEEDNFCLLQPYNMAFKKFLKEAWRICNFCLEGKRGDTTPQFTIIPVGQSAPGEEISFGGQTIFIPSNIDCTWVTPLLSTPSKGVCRPKYVITRSDIIPKLTSFGLAKLLTAKKALPENSAVIQLNSTLRTLTPPSPLPSHRVIQLSAPNTLCKNVRYTPEGTPVSLTSCTENMCIACLHHKGFFFITKKNSKLKARNYVCNSAICINPYFDFERSLQYIRCTDTDTDFSRDIIAKLKESAFKEIKSCLDMQSALLQQDFTPTFNAMHPVPQDTTEGLSFVSDETSYIIPQRGMPPTWFGIIRPAGGTRFVQKINADATPAFSEKLRGLHPLKPIQNPGDCVVLRVVETDQLYPYGMPPVIL